MLNGLWEGRLFQRDKLWPEKQQFWGSFTTNWISDSYRLESKITLIWPRNNAEKASTFRREADDISPKSRRHLAEEPVALRFLDDFFSILSFFRLKIVLKSWQRFVNIFTAILPNRAVEITLVKSMVGRSAATIDRVSCPQETYVVTTFYRFFLAFHNSLPNFAIGKQNAF